jgi:hypothetical protein
MYTKPLVYPCNLVPPAASAPPNKPAPPHEPAPPSKSDPPSEPAPPSKSAPPGKSAVSRKREASKSQDRLKYICKVCNVNSTRDKCYKTLKAVIYEWAQKPVRLSLTGLSSLVLFVRQGANP